MARNALHPVSTTTLRVTIPDASTYTQLDNHFMLARYVIPNDFSRLPDRDKSYSLLHIALKTQLNRPYMTYQNDELDGKQQMVVYALYRREPSNQDFRVVDIDLRETFRFVHGLLDKREISFADLELHMALKLLLTDYFHGGWNKAFIGQGKKYIYVSGFNGFHKCLEVQLNGHRDNKNQKEAQWFQITGHARQFRNLLPDERFDEVSRKYKEFYTPVIQHGQTTLAQLLPDTTIDKDRVLKPYIDEDHPAKLPYHNHTHLDQGRGKLLYDFHQGFIQYLSQYGLEASSQTRMFQRFPSRYKNQTLPVNDMGTIAVLDLCFDTENIAQERPEFWATLHRLYPNYQAITEEDLSEEDYQTPVLILQNYGKKDFEAGGVYEGQVDPKPSIYREYPHVPKQTLDIRPKILKPQADDDKDTEDEAAPEALALRLQVSLNELYLKYLLLNNLPVAGRLPGYGEAWARRKISPAESEQSPLEAYAFLRKQTYDGVPREILLAYDQQNECLALYDVGSDPEARNAVLQTLDLDWSVIHRQLLKRRFAWDEDKQNAKEGKELKRYDLIFSPGLAIEIEDINESVFYDYDRIAERQRQNQQLRPITRFQLPYDDSIFTPEQCEAFNTFLLREVKEDTITYRLLKKMYGEQIIQILDLRDKNGNPRFQELTKAYQRMGLLASLKAADLLVTSQGIWFDDEGRYVIGNPDAINKKQAVAHKIRQLTRVRGEKEIDVSLMMSLMAVDFVRNKRFTVYPYQFKLIDLYAEMTHWML
ncbi:MAG: hypothetical protein HZC41_00625 [Chloroflexi bacterium]|nr:hypothetical protein [Chloroflexota bacterium]